MAVALVALALGLGLAVPPVAAQTNSQPTTTTSTTVPPFAGAPAPAPAPASGSTTVPATSVAPVPDASGATVTPTPAPPAPWAVSVPGPPPPASVAASPADIARANQLERQIVAQSDALDVLAEQYDQAQQAVAATEASLEQVDGRLATTRTSTAAAQAGVATAGQALRVVAVDAYVSLRSAAPSGPEALLRAYERGAAQTGAETAMGKALGQLQQLHTAEQQLRAAESAIAGEAQKASDAHGAAQAAAARAQVAAQGASTQQQQLLATVSQVGGNLGPLVLAAHAAEAQRAFNRFSQAGGLDFPPAAALGAPAAQAAAVVQYAVAQAGKPYVWGAAGPDAFDCSGLVEWAWGRVGVALPRVAADQQAATTPVPISQLAPGDLVFFGAPAHHVGIYVGAGMMVDAPHSGAYVSVVPIWWDDLSGFGRVNHR